MKLTQLPDVPVCCHGLVECLSSQDQVLHHETFQHLQQILSHMMNTVNKLADDMLGYWHHTVICLSVCLSICDAVHCG